MGYYKKMITNQAVFLYELYQCAFGTGAVCWRQEKKAARIVRVFLPANNKEAEALLRAAYPGVERGEHPALNQTITKLKALTGGMAVCFDLSLLAWDLCPPFQRRVLRAEAQVPAGRVTTYGRLAARIGAPGAARAVGHALATNPVACLCAYVVFGHYYNRKIQKPLPRV